MIGNLRPFLQEFSRQVPTAEAQQFATRMSSLFIETSAKTSVGVKEVFQEVVEQILDTPELWESGRSHNTAGGGGGMPGGVQVVGLQDNTGKQDGGSCSC